MNEIYVVRHQVGISNSILTKTLHIGRTKYFVTNSESRMTRMESIFGRGGGRGDKFGKLEQARHDAVPSRHSTERDELGQPGHELPWTSKVGEEVFQS